MLRRRLTKLFKFIHRHKSSMEKLLFIRSCSLGTINNETAVIYFMVYCCNIYLYNQIDIQMRRNKKTAKDRVFEEKKKFLVSQIILKSISVTYIRKKIKFLRIFLATND